MPRPAQPGKAEKGSLQALRVVISLILLTGLTALSAPGCAGQHKKEEDPLVGPGPKGLQKVDPGTTTKTKSQVPPLPTANTAGSNAALVVGPEPLSGGRNLGIPDGKLTGGAGGWQGIGPDGKALPTTSGRWDGVRTASGTILKQPEPIVEEVPRIQPGPQAAPAQPVPAPAVPSASTLPAGDGIEQLQAALKARGVVSLRPEATTKGVRVTCAIPDTTRPDNLHFYAAEAADQPAALRALITKIDQDRRR
jgi:hypothetical protein